MKPGQVLTQWWQNYVLGRLRTPQSIVRASRVEKRQATPTEDRFTKAVVESQHWAAPTRLMVPQFLRSEAHLHQMTRADWQQSDDRLRLWACRVVLRAEKSGIPLYVHSCFRTKKEQQELRARGVSKVGYPNSAHNIGEAVDIVHGIYHWEMSDDEWKYIHFLGLDELRKLNAGRSAADKLDLVWGGPDRPHDTFGWDPAHWEIADYRDRIRLTKDEGPLRMTPARTVEFLRA